MTRPVPDDTRGIVDPDEMMRHVDFARDDPGKELDGIVEWFWSVAWDLPAGFVHDQQVLNHPAGNISIGTIDDGGVRLDPAEGRLYGVMTELSNRRLSGFGWTVAARTAVGGLGVILDAPAKSVVGKKLTLDDAIPGCDGASLVPAVRAIDTNSARVDRLRDALNRVISQRDVRHVAEAREVSAVANVAERDRNIRLVDQLAAHAGVSVRTLQRLFDQHVGVSPAFVIRRWRIIEAAEAARRAANDNTEWVGWAATASALGYADQAHLTRDFQRHVGASPTAYVARIAT